MENKKNKVLMILGIVAIVICVFVFIKLTMDSKKSFLVIGDETWGYVDKKWSNIKNTSGIFDKYNFNVYMDHEYQGKYEMKYFNNIWYYFDKENDSHKFDGDVISLAGDRTITFKDVDVLDITDSDLENIKLALKDKNIEIDVEENGTTFYENAYKKAKEIYELTKEATIADDSGLCIKALDDFPGVLTHRFLGENKTDEERNLALIEKTNEKDDRTAKVICNLVYYDGKNIIVGEGVINGKIATSPRGDNGFGFDPIFELTTGKTLAELSKEQKNSVSARFLAAKDLKERLMREGLI